MPGFSFICHLHGFLKYKLPIPLFDFATEAAIVLLKKILEIHSSFLNQAEFISIYHNIYLGLFSFLCFISSGILGKQFDFHLTVLY